MGSNCITHPQNMEKSTRTKKACWFSRPVRSCCWEAASGHALYHSSVELNDLYSRNQTTIRWQLPPNNMHKSCAKFFFYSALFAATSDTTEKYHTWQNIITQWLNMEGGGGLFKLICQCNVDLNTAQTHSTRAELKHSWTETCFLSGRSSLLGCVWLNSSGKG